MDERDYSAPALERGIRVIRELTAERPLSLEQLAGRTDIPKASLTRVMETLRRLGVVGRSELDKRYYPLMTLTPVDNSGSGLAAALGETLSLLAERLGRTAEWYVPGRGGLVIAERREPISGTAMVKATLGFTRELDGELDAVALAAITNGVGEFQAGRHWRYQAGEAGLSRRRVSDEDVTPGVIEWIDRNAETSIYCRPWRKCSNARRSPIGTA